VEWPTSDLYRTCANIATWKRRASKVRMVLRHNDAHAPLGRFAGTKADAPQFLGPPDPTGFRQPCRNPHVVDPTQFPGPGKPLNRR
jgi:hypothetical protein